MITSFKNKDHKMKKRYGKYRTLTSIKESVDTVVTYGETTTSVTLSVFGVGLIVVPISAGNKSALSLRNKLLHKIILNKYNLNKEQN